MPYASRTVVTAPKTRHEIESFLLKRGATTIGFVMMPTAGVVTFDMKDRRVRFAVSWNEKASEQSIRSLWRALLLCIKAKLASVESGIETFEQAFLAHVILPDDNRTVYERMKPRQWKACWAAAAAGFMIARHRGRVHA
jgi:hypothetical protein